MNQLKLSALVLALAGAMSSAQAAPVSYSFTAEVSSLSAYQNGSSSDTPYAELAGRHLALGEKLVGTLTYDASSAQFAFDNDPGSPGTNYAYNVPTFKLEYTSESGGYSFSSSDPGFANVTNTAAFDSLSLESAVFPVEQGAQLRSVSTLYFGDNSGTLFTSAAMPASINSLFPGLLAQSVLGGGITLLDGSAYFNYGARLTSFAPSAVSAVPEPETYMMMFGGLGLLGLAARRKRRDAGV
jgi:hypothetical protein